MKLIISTTSKIVFLLMFYVLLGAQTTYGQETAPNLNSNSTYHNQLFYNRFLVNPTFSLVREDKSYLNILHRNQHAAFDDNNQNYFLGFSHRLNESTAVGIGVYSQSSGVLKEFGFNANYATSVKLGAKSKLTFGTNVTYFSEGLDKDRVIVLESDTKLNESRKESKLAVQPGVTLSIGKFDFGLYAEDLFKYNQTTNEFSTSLNAENIKASLQYTHNFTAKRGLFADARFMPLLQAGKNEFGGLAYVGSLLLDLPKYGWFQTTFDDTYGLSMGIGVNLSKKMSLGYLLEKDLSSEDANLGLNHEVSLAYKFKDNNFSGEVYADSSEDQKIDGIIRNYEEQILTLIAEKKESERKNGLKSRTENIANETAVTDVNALAYQNRLILDELMLRQDSIEEARNAQFEKRFEMMVRTVRNEIKHNLKTYTPDANGGQNVILIANKEQSKPKHKKQSEIKNNFKPLTPEINAAQNVTLATNEEQSKPEHKKQSEIKNNFKPINTAKNATLVANKEQSKPKVKKQKEIKNNFKPLTSEVNSTQNETKIANDDRFKPIKQSDYIKHNFNPLTSKVSAEQNIVAISDENQSKPEHRFKLIDQSDYVSLPIEVLDQGNLDGAKSGYYLIVNVYKTKKYLNSFMDTLKEQGLNVKQFFNKENGLYYVYLADYNYKEEAQTAYVSNLNGKYLDEKWIMQVDTNTAIVDNMYDD